MSNVSVVMIFFVGIVLGANLELTMVNPVLTDQRVTISEQSATIQKQKELLLWYVNELSLFKEGVDRLREQQEANNILIMKVEDFYKVDLAAATKGGPGKLEKLVAERIQQYRGRGGN